MNLSSWAIRNPVPVVLLFVLLTLLGIFSYRALPVQNMPDMDLPLIYITTTLEGAAPEQLETEVARKIEDRLASLSRLDHIQTTLTNGLVNITAIFEIGKNPDTALNEVRNAVESARHDLPPDATPPSVTKNTTQFETLATYALRSDHLDETELSWFADHDLARALLAVRGVGEVTRLGGVDREIHVDLDPAALSALGLTAADISATLRSMQADHPGGRAEISAGRQTLRALGALRDADALAALRIPLAGGAAVRLDEIAAVTDTHADRTSLATLDGEPIIALQIKRANGYSDIEVLAGIRAALATLRAQTPAITLTEAATTIGPTLENYNASLHMLWEGALIAIIVVLIFLKNGRATLIAATALPLSILPAFTAMRALGLGLNNISLLALTLVIGVLVDDAIVEIENIARHARPGKSPAETADEAAREIGLAVVATTLALVAVFLPTAFMGGIFGLVFREFGITAAAATLASLLVARLLTPMLAAKWMKPAATTAPRKDGPLMRAYLALVQKALAHRKTTAAALAAFLAASLSLALLLNTALFPPQDNSQTTILLTLPPGTPLSQTAHTAAAATAIIQRDPDVKTILAAIGTAAAGDGGPDTINMADHASATLTLTLAPPARRLGNAARPPANDMRVGTDLVSGRGATQSRALPAAAAPALDASPAGSRDTARPPANDADEPSAFHKSAPPKSAPPVPQRAPRAPRKRTQGEIENDLRAALAALPGVRVEVGAGADGARLDLTLAGDDPRQLETTAALLETQLRTLRDIGAVISGAALATPEIQITPDPAQAAAHGVTTEAMAGVIRVATSGDYAANLAKLNLPGRQLPIRVRLAPALRENLDALAQLRVPAAAATAATGANATAATNTNTNTATAAAAGAAAIALGDIARIEIGAGPAMITRLDRARNHTLSIELAGRTLGEVAAEALRLPALQNLPPGITRVEQGEMEDMTEMFGSFGFAMLVGLFCIYAVLVLLFHDFLQPLTILMAIPLALGGALLPLVLTGGSFSMPALIGLLMLTGIVTKNSILLVDYIIKAREKGLPRPAALHEACRHRVRPILMTTLAMTGGMLPTVLGLAGGDPSFRQPMALVVVGGLTTSTLLSLVVIPVAYTLLDDATAWAARLSRRRTAR